MTAAPAPLTVKEPSFQEMNQLIILFNERRYSEMEAQARAMTQRFPDHGIGWKLLGAALKVQGEETKALEPMKKAAALLPKDAEVHNNLGVTLHGLGHLLEAEASYRRALDIRPDLASAHTNLGINIQ